MIAQKAVDPFHPHLAGYTPGARNDYEKEIWDFLIEEFAPNTMLDIGCGEGNAMEYFWDNGFTEPYGIDGTEILIPTWKERRLLNRVHLCDFTRYSINPRLFDIDLVWSCEFVEHVEEQFIHNFMPLLVCGKYLAMTHAHPGQKGYHHVNCQPPEYWIGRVPMQYDKDTTKHLQSLGHNSGKRILFFRK